MAEVIHSKKALAVNPLKVSQPVGASLAADSDLLGMQVRFLTGMGAEIVAAVSPYKHESLVGLLIAEVIVGDLEGMEKEARARAAQFIVANSHAAEAAHRLGLHLGLGRTVARDARLGRSLHRREWHDPLLAVGVQH